MNGRLRLLTAALGVAATATLTVGCNRTPPPADEPPVAPVAVIPVDDSTKPADDSKHISTTPADVKMVTAVTPKPLSEAVKKGLVYLAETQQADGGWNQGGGWRTGDKGNGRVEGKEVADPSDVGNTAFALLAFLRAGHTATAGEYKDVVGKGLAFLCKQVSAADGDSLYVTDVRNTQLQSKIGTYVDTFMATLVLTEFKGQAGEHEQAVAAARDKSLDKIAKHQTEKGEFAGNTGWASNLSWGIANKALSRAKMSGAKVNEQLLTRATTGVRAQAAAEPGGLATPGFGSTRGGFGGGGGAPADRVGGSYAGVGLYGQSQSAANLRDSRNAVQGDLNKAREVLKKESASKEEKEKAAAVVDEAKKADKLAADGEAQLGKSIRDKGFVAGFGSNGGEEFLSFLNISETLLVKAGDDWTEWNNQMQEAIPKAQDKDGSWSGKHCITGKTFCTSAALLVLLADRTPFPADVLADARAVKADVKTESKEKK